MIRGVEIMKISIIIPIYNTPIEFLKKCFDSCINQTYSDIEILGIDDGSKNETSEFLDELKLKDDRIKIYHKNNSGVSKTRNYGLDNVSPDSKFVFFLDADDYIENYTLERMVESLTKNNLDLIQFNYSQFDKSRCYHMEDIENEIVPIKEDKSILYNLIAVNYSKYYFSKFYGGIKAVWNKLFKFDIIKQNNIRFDENLNYGEDCIFMYDYLKCCNLICFKNEFTYYYRQDDTSITHIHSKKVVDDNLKLIELYTKKYLVYDQNFYTCINRQILSCYFQVINKYLISNKCSLKNSDKILILQDIYNHINIYMKNYDKGFFSFKEKIFLDLIKRRKFRILLLLFKFKKS